MTMPDLHVDHDAPTPPFEQICRGIVAQISAGTLAPGQRLPPVRALAAELGVAANTAARAYRELEQAGVLVTRGRHGTFVSDDPDPARHAARLAAEAYATQVRTLGIDVEVALALVRRALEDG